jgi:predicted permease
MTRDWPFAAVLLAWLLVLTGGAYVDLRTFGLVLVAEIVGFLAGVLFVMWWLRRSERTEIDVDEDEDSKT